MQRKIDEMDLVREKHNITVPTGTRKADHREETEEHDNRFHTLKASCSRTHAFLINSGASNHMVASRESFSFLQYFDGPRIQLGNKSKVQTK